MKQVLFGSLLLLLFTACSPRIGTSITKTYPSLNADSPVAVYLYQTEVPSGTESLGRVTISDTGFSVICDSTTVVNLIKDEARKTGGNAVCITDHKKPSIWGSSCHQMTAIILKVKDFDQPNHSDENSIEEFGEVKNAVIKSTLPKFKIGANIGYGWRSAKLSSDVTGDMRNFEKKLMSGIIWDGLFNYYFNEMYGVGLTYSSYSTSYSEYGYVDEEPGTLSKERIITFIGPVFAMRGATSNEKWILNLNMGIGYLGFYSNETFNSRYLKANGATVGFSWNIGGEYKFNKHWGVGVDLSMIGGILKEMNINENGSKSTYVFEDNKEEGLGQYRLTTGLRYYF